MSAASACRRAPQPPREWTLYGQTYHLDSFLQHHPGGDLALLLGAGRDATTLFEQYHPRPARALAVLASLAPTPSPAPAPAPPPADAFHAELLAAARALPGGTRATWSHVALCAAFAAASGACWVGWARGSLPALLALPFAQWLLSVNVAHDAGHFAFSAWPLANELLALLSAPLMYHTSHWYLQHNVSHHGHTNELGKDIDLSHFAPWARLTRAAPWRALHRAQVAVVAAAFCTACVAETLVFPWLAPCKRRQLGEAAHVHARTRAAGALQLLASAAVLLLPLATMPLRAGLLFALYPYAITSLLFMCITQISHLQAEAQAGGGGSSSSSSNSAGGGGHWARAQVEASLDYAQDSRLVTYLTGGLNSQGLHHCLPFLSSSRFVEFYPVYRGICARHGVAIKETPGFGTSLAMFWGHIEALSHKDAAA
jgi:fatty acid desaturase